MKTDSKYPGPLAPPQEQPTKGEPPSKYDFDNYDDANDEDDENEDGNDKPFSPGLGPGFFNPTLPKPQYNDYDFNGDNFHRPSSSASAPHQHKPQKPNPYNPYIIRHGDGKHELINILGGNAQNIPPQINIEHLLHQIQGGVNGGGGDGGGVNAANGDGNGQSQSTYGIQQTPDGLSYPFDIGQRPLPYIPSGGNQKEPIQPQGNSTYYYFCTHTHAHMLVDQFSTAFV